MPSASPLLSLAPLLETGAKAGSPVCRTILEKGANELTDMVRQLVPLISCGERFTLLLWGSVLLKNQEIQGMTARIAHRDWKHVSVCVPQCTALDCAVLLARGEKRMPVREIR